METGWGLKVHTELYPVSLNDVFLSVFEPLSAANDWLHQRRTVALWTYQVVSQWEEGHLKRKNAFITPGRKSTQAAPRSLMRSPDFENERPIMHITQWQSVPTARTLLYWNILHCSKITTRIPLRAFVLQKSRNQGLTCSQWSVSEFTVGGADGVHTWLSDIGECLADGSQTKHVLGLHFEVVPMRTKHIIMS